MMIAVDRVLDRFFPSWQRCRLWQRFKDAQYNVQTVREWSSVIAGLLKEKPSEFRTVVRLTIQSVISSVVYAALVRTLALDSSRNWAKERLSFEWLNRWTRSFVVWTTLNWIRCIEVCESSFYEISHWFLRCASLFRIIISFSRSVIAKCEPVSGSFIVYICVVF